MAVRDDVVIITGANRGIGLGLARALDALGRRVAGFDLEVDNLSGIEAFVCDITDAGQVEEAVARVVEKWGRIDVLVNNACVAIFSPFEERDLETIRREFEVNYFGHLNTIRAVLPYMKAQGGGVIHNVSSTVGFSGFPGLSGYASTKGALEALSRTLTVELEPYGITVNVIHPPLTRTTSSAPLGVPDRVMADPEVVGRKLAPKIGSRRSVVTPGWVESAGVLMARWFPGGMGRLLGRAAGKIR